MTKLNTILKTSVLALAVLIVAFTFSACGKGQFTNVKVDTKGDYQDSTQSTVLNLVEDDALLEGINGYHMTFEEVMTYGTTTTKTTYNVLIKETSSENADKLEMAIKMTASVNGEKSSTTLYFISNDPTEGETTRELYADMNMKLGTETIKGKYKLDLDSSYAEGLLGTCKMMYNNIESYLPTEGNQMATTNQFAVSQKDNTTKIRITIPGATEAQNAEFYYVLKDGKLNGIKIANLVEVDSEFGMTTTVNVTIAPWNGDIDYPNFDKYETFQMPTIPSLQ